MTRRADVRRSRSSRASTTATVAPWVRAPRAGHVVGDRRRRRTADLVATSSSSWRATTSSRPLHRPRGRARAPRRCATRRPRTSTTTPSWRPRRAATRALEETIAQLAALGQADRGDGPRGRAPQRRSCCKALTNAPTGGDGRRGRRPRCPRAAMGERTWDYRYSWIRDSTFAARSLAELGCGDGGRRVPPLRRAQRRRARRRPADPVRRRRRAAPRRARADRARGLARHRRRCASATPRPASSSSTPTASSSNLAWRWHERGNSPDDDYWRFLVDARRRRRRALARARPRDLGVARRAAPLRALQGAVLGGARPRPRGSPRSACARRR